jgi:spore coat-associated protein N
MATTNSRKVLVPLATLLAAGAVAIGSGADWTSTSNSSISASSGDLAHVNSEDNATLAVTNLKPGASETGSLTITNTGTLDSDLTMDPSGNTDTFVAGAVTLTVVADGDEVYSGDFADLTDTLDLGSLDADVASDAITVVFTVEMDDEATDANQDKDAGVDLEFVTTSTSGDESSAVWTP